MTKQDVLRSITFGQRVAEDETDLLGTYFVETDHWVRLFRGDIDVVYGAKGAGKSALYALLLSRRDDLFDRNVLLYSLNLIMIHDIFMKSATRAILEQLQCRFIYVRIYSSS